MSFSFSPSKNPKSQGASLEVSFRIRTLDGWNLTNTPTKKKSVLKA